MIGMAAGIAIAVASLAGAIILGQRNPTLAGILVGPGLASALSTFVLRRSFYVEARRQRSASIWAQEIFLLRPDFHPFRLPAQILGADGRDDYLPADSRGTEKHPMTELGEVGRPTLAV